MRQLVILCLLLLTFSVQGQPALSVLTVHTDDQQGYHQWMRGSAGVIGKQLGAMALGVCQPTIGAEDPNHLYAWSIGRSHSALLSAMDKMTSNQAVITEVAKIADSRQIQQRDLWSLILPPKTSFKAGSVTYNWHVMVKTDNLMAYVDALKAFIKDSSNNGFADIDMAIYVGNSGKYANTTMVVAYAPSAARLGDFFDQRFSPWSMNHMKKFSQLRKINQAFVMRCETMYSS